MNYVFNIQYITREKEPYKVVSTANLFLSSAILNARTQEMNAERKWRKRKIWSKRVNLFYLAPLSHPPPNPHTHCKYLRLPYNSKNCHKDRHFIFSTSKQLY